jgi:outer membrane autotransporter protein
MAFMPILYQNSNFKFLTTPSLGAGYGKYERGAVSGNYEADTLDLYYGLYNHAEYSVDMKVAELVAEAELNVQGSYMTEAEEDDGWTLKSNNTLSMEAGIGLKLRKKMELAKNRSLMLAVGAKYYHEFLDPYRDLDIGKSGVYLSRKGYDEDKNRLRTTAEAIYKDGDFSVSAEIAHNAEKESSVEGGLGVRYSF